MTLTIATPTWSNSYSTIGNATIAEAEGSFDDWCARSCLRTGYQSLTIALTTGEIVI